MLCGDDQAEHGDSGFAGRQTADDCWGAPEEGAGIRARASEGVNAPS